MSAMPSIMDFGAAKIISPDGSEQIPPEMWAELEVLILAEPEPAELTAWERRLEHRLGVTTAHRRALAGQPVSTGEPWTILSVAPLMERKVAAALGPKSRENPHGLGLTVYVPIETYKPKTANVARAHRPWKPRTRALIPGVIFALLEDDRALDKARSNHAVRRILCDRSGQPLKVRSIDIGAMILAEACGDFDSTRRESGVRKGRRRGRRGAGDAPARWKSGQRVKIGDGPFAGFVGEITRMGRDERLEVLVTIFGRPTPIVLDEAMIAEEGE